MSDFPELTSFGTLFKFAVSLEEAAAELAQAAAKKEDCAASWRDFLSDCAAKHQKRSKRLEQLRRERLNEVVLQPIAGMDAENYAPEAVPEGDAKQALGALATTEEKAAQFYEDAAKTAANVLTGVEKTLLKLARQNKEIATELRAKVL